MRSILEIYSEHMSQSNKTYLIGIKYEFWNNDAYMVGQPLEEGWEENYREVSLPELKEYASSYGIGHNSSSNIKIWNNDMNPKKEPITGEDIYYTMVVKNVDGSEITSQDIELINNQIINSEV